MKVYVFMYTYYGGVGNDIIKVLVLARDLRHAKSLLKKRGQADLVERFEKTRRREKQPFGKEVWLEQPGLQEGGYVFNWGDLYIRRKSV